MKIRQFSEERIWNISRWALQCIHERLNNELQEATKEILEFHQRCWAEHAANDIEKANLFLTFLCLVYKKYDDGDADDDEFPSMLSWRNDQDYLHIMVTADIVYQVSIKSDGSEQRNMSGWNVQCVNSSVNNEKIELFMLS